MKKDKLALLLLISSLSLSAWSQPVDLDLEDPDDLELLLEDINEDKGTNPNVNKDLNKRSAKVSGDNSLEEEIEELDFDDSPETKSKKKTAEQKGDDLDSLMEDIGEIEFSLPEESEVGVKEVEDSENEKITKAQKSKIKILREKEIKGKEARIIYDVGKLEKELLEKAKKMQGKIPNSEWNEIAGNSAEGTYEVVTGDWLWKISKNIFGSGFYYSKIWALNPYITNPHEIEPGMILSFSTGSDNNLPALNLQRARKKLYKSAQLADEYDKWGDDARPKWITEREELKDRGVYLQYSTGDTEEDLRLIGEQSLINEYETYEPPKLDFVISAPEDEYDSVGFDKNAKVSFDFKEGFYLNTFITNNVVQDFGKIEAAIRPKSILETGDTIFVRFDEKIDVISGDKFSMYTAGGLTTQLNSDRKGYKYIISGSFETIQKHDGLWECEIIENAIPVSRGDRVTVYTPKIERITQTYNSRLIESVLFGTFEDLKTSASFGDVVYIDRGRADGLELGNILEVYGFKDRGTGLNITDNPTYKNGELTIITVTDNFATALVSNSRRDFSVGDIAVTKTKEAAARATRIRNKLATSTIGKLSDKDLDELDIELNLDDLNDSLLDKADQIQFTEDELAELERQEREKSILTENEKDLRSLERLESELETAELMLNEARLDEDKLLEDQDLNKVERDFGVDEQESLDELEENFGKRYLDEDLNDKENPYGLTEFDIEEIDELLNAEKESSGNETQ